MKPGLILPVAGLCMIAAAAQPPAETSVKISGKTISTSYTAPAPQNGKVFGAVVPYNKVWSIGKQPAVFHTDGDLVFQGFVVPKGDYTLWVLPVTAERWQLIVSKQKDPKAAYNPKLDAGRAVMKLAPAPAPVETCTLRVKKTAALAAAIEVSWENTIASAQFHLERVAGDSEW